MSLETLPSELIWALLDRLDPSSPDFWTLQATCRRLRDLVRAWARVNHLSVHRPWPCTMSAGWVPEPGSVWEVLRTYHLDMPYCSEHLDGYLRRWDDERGRYEYRVIRRFPARTDEIRFL